MIDKNKFYDDNELPDFKTRKKIWGFVKEEIKNEKKILFHQIELRSFSLGLAAAVVMFFTFIGAKTTIQKFIDNSQPINSKINDVYLEAINNFEKSLPVILADKKNSVELDNVISVRQEQLATIDNAIEDFNNSQESFDQSPVKQKRLRELYKMKLEVLNEIITLEGREK